MGSNASDLYLFRCVDFAVSCATCGYGNVRGRRQVSGQSTPSNDNKITTIKILIAFREAEKEDGLIFQGPARRNARARGGGLTETWRGIGQVLGGTLVSNLACHPRWGGGSAPRIPPAEIIFEAGRHFPGGLVGRACLLPRSPPGRRPFRARRDHITTSGLQERDLTRHVPDAR